MVGAAEDTRVGPRGLETGENREIVAFGFDGV